jgi:hypothetical protein
MPNSLAPAAEPTGTGSNLAKSTFTGALPAEARMNSASVIRRSPRHRAYAFASAHVT